MSIGTITFYLSSYRIVPSVCDLIVNCERATSNAQRVVSSFHRPLLNSLRKRDDCQVRASRVLACCGAARYLNLMMISTGSARAETSQTSKTLHRVDKSRVLRAIRTLRTQHSCCEYFSSRSYACTRTFYENPFWYLICPR